MDKTTVIEIVKQYAVLVNSKYAADKIVLYGSYAKGNYCEDSDIDVAVLLQSCGTDFLSVATDLYGLAGKINYRIEPVLLDVKTDKSGFVQDIMKYGIVIFDKNNKTL